MLCLSAFELYSRWVPLTLPQRSELSCASPISKVERDISDRYSYHTGKLVVSVKNNLSGMVLTKTKVVVRMIENIASAEKQK